jgi:hypothetical protein
VGFVVDKTALGQVFSENVGSTCQSLYRMLIIIRHHPELVKWASGDLSNIGLGSTPNKK